MCLQEVDRFQDLQEELKIQGYCGVWKMRTGPPIDGCAIFWRTTRFRLLHEEEIEYDKLGLRNNVAQICVLESRSQSPAENASAASPASSHHSRGANQVVVCNIHVLYNPNRGDIKIGQVRVLLDRAHAVSRNWNDAPVIICGDFNCIPKSPLYNFISEQKLNLSGLAKNQISGQFSASVYTPRPNGSNVGHGLNRVQSPSDNLTALSASVDNRAESVDLTDTYNQHMSQSASEGSSLIDNLSCPQSVDGVLDMASKPFFDDCYEENNTMSEAVAEEKGQEITLDGSSYECGSTQSGFIDALPKTVNGYSVQGGPSVDQPNLQKSNPAVAALQEDSVLDDMEKEKLEFSMTSSSCEGNVCDIVTSHNKVDSGADTSDCSSSDVASGTSFPDGIEVSFPKCMENLSSKSATIEDKTNPSISYKNSDKDELLNASTCVDRKGVHLSPHKVCELMKEDESLGGIVKTTYSSEEMVRCRTKDASSFDANYEKKILNLEEAIQSLEVCSSTNKVQGDQRHYVEVREISSEAHCFGVDQSAEISNMLCSASGSRGHSNAELTDKETSYESMEEMVSNVSPSDQIQSLSCLDENESLKLMSSEGHGNIGLGDDPSISLDSKEIDVERKAYDPYIWTPIEIATASGNAECILVEHHLKLKSTYAQVEDYAGTKDPSREPLVTSYNRQFLGTVDYIWCSEGLETVQVLDTMPKHVLQKTPGFPTRKWGSDHLALASQLAFTRDIPTDKKT
ncbi:carbon catabolite repressor protein 4 homolog 6 isoform X4 [Magnolia sinica]|nr:carbon catabolite repressor protein 4 homolog 6 isoform X4 [Magnolia sinica]